LGRASTIFSDGKGDAKGLKCNGPRRMKKQYLSQFHTRRPKMLPNKKTSKCCERRSPPARVDNYQNPMQKDISRQSDAQTISPDQRDHDHSKLLLNLRHIVIYS
uniref:Ovule protein n=1 Tax=Toxocara canis TaxID=6265 RepID=A0A183U598_TOXCA